ncbi:MAG: FecR domain-containing protein, partial [Verrucomicrobiota bacterium]
RAMEERQAPVCRTPLAQTSRHWMDSLHGFFRRHAGVAGVTAAFCLGFVFWAGWPGSEHARIAGGHCHVRRAGRTLPAEKPVDLQAADIIVADEAEATLTYPDGSVIRLSAESELHIVDFSAKQLNLHKGGIHVTAAPQSKAYPMVITAPTAAATVIGTRFFLSAAPGATWISVQEGAVHFAKTNQPERSSLIKSGEFAVATAGMPIAAHQLPANAEKPESLVLDLPIAEGRARGDGIWRVQEGAVSQSKVTTGATWIGLAGTDQDPTSTFDVLTTLSGSFLLEGSGRVDHAQELSGHPVGSWQGCAWRVGFGNQIVKLAFIDYGERGVLNLSLTRTDAATSGIDLAMDRCPRFQAGTYRMKLLVRRTSDTHIQVSGKLWQGETEPEEWMVSARMPISDSVYRLGFETTHCACTFEKSRLLLIP